MMPKIEWYSVEGDDVRLLSLDQANKLSKEKNIIKFDGYRKENKWTVLGPSGRVGDFGSWLEAVEYL